MRHLLLYADLLQYLFENNTLSNIDKSLSLEKQLANHDIRSFASIHSTRWKYNEGVSIVLFFWFLILFSFSFKQHIHLLSIWMLQILGIQLEK